MIYYPIIPFNVIFLFRVVCVCVHGKINVCSSNSLFLIALFHIPICVFLTGPIVSTSTSHHHSDSDWLLLETLDTRRQRQLHTGRFLTMHKRRRKRLTTRSLTQEPGLLDDIHHGQVQVYMRLMNNPTNSLVEEPQCSTKAHHWT
jgi:hypothetical protein